VFFVFFGGPENDPKKRVFRTFVSIGIKMLLSFVLALVYFLIFKLREPPLVILFFVLYLGFTLFIVFTFRSILKNRLV